MKNFLLILFSFASVFSNLAFPQQQYIPLNNSINDIIDNKLLEKGVNFHYSVKPYRINEISKFVNIDSIHNTLKFNTRSKSMNLFLNNVCDGYDLVKGKTNITANALIFAEGGIENPGNNKLLGLGIGAYIKGDIGKNFSFYADLMFNNSEYLNYTDSLIKEYKVIPGEGIATKSSLGYYYRNLNFYVTFSPSKNFSLEAGKGKNFWGDGYRSLLLSDNANSYPYLKLTTTFWKLKYVNLFTNLRNIDDSIAGIKDNKTRYSAMHYLSWNILKWMNLSLFEAVMFKGTETLGNNGIDTVAQRGFDINYLNPVTIYRPVEYSMGSPDNVIMGANIDVRVHKKNLIYFQLMLDEFVLSHVKARDGWWANKQAFQIGLKSYDIFKIKNLSFQTEYNYIRPFTYSHFDLAKNYSNYNQPLAHPLGANMKESVSILKYRINKLQFKLKFNYAIYGSDTGKASNGQNIFKPYTDRPKDKNNNPIELDYRIGNPVKNVLQYAEFNISYTLNSRASLILEAGVINRSHTVSGITKNDNFIYIGIKNLFENRYFDN